MFYPIYGFIMKYGFERYLLESIVYLQRYKVPLLLGGGNIEFLGKKIYWGRI